MKNISLTVNPYQRPLYPAAPAAPPTPNAIAQSIPKLIYSVALSVQFENETEALAFATKLINVVTGDAE